MNIRAGHIARHTPRGAGAQGREAAVVDVAQDLHRTTTARDMYDLRWLMTSPSIAPTIDTDLVRRLAVLKIWVDTNGMHAGETYWRPGHTGSTFDPQRWLRARDESEFDPEDIGALAVPRPTAKEMSDAVRERFAFLADLGDDERIIARSDPRDRSLVIRAMSELPAPTFDCLSLY